MSETNTSVSECASTSSIIATECPENNALRITVDLAAAARRNVGFLQHVAESDWLHRTPVLFEAIRRYHALWMPLISDLTVDDKPPMLVPPFDVEWVWFCHSLDPAHYREYCESRFSKLIGKPEILDEENENYAFDRCRDIWSSRFSNEPFENEMDPDSRDPVSSGSLPELLGLVLKLRNLYYLFNASYVRELVYLIAAKRRYKKFLAILQSFPDGCSSSLVPASDILLMWCTHMSYPTVYVADTMIFGSGIARVIGPWIPIGQEDLEETKKQWDMNFDQPYEKAGGMIAVDLVGGVPIHSPIHWVPSDFEDVNTKYKSMHPRFLMEVCVFIRLMPELKTTRGKTEYILRLGMLKCHRDLKLDRAISSYSSSKWQKVFHQYCEYGTKGVILELREHGGSICMKGTGLLENFSVSWNELQRLPSLAAGVVLGQRVRAFTSITPPVQAPYLLKCVPDRVTDDSGAMISDLILKLNRYHPQEGRWLSRTVLDHAGRECFVIRIRVGGGFWRRGGESPETVNWRDRIIEVREGGWSYVADSIGRAPEKVLGTATPQKEWVEDGKATWCLSTGDELTIQGASTSTTTNLSFTLHNQNSSDSVKLLNGCRMQYSKSKNSSSSAEDDINEGEEEEGFVTLIRCTDENPDGKATALLNWKLLVMEILPEEDVVLVLLLCLAILRSISEIRKEDVGKLLIRRRMKEPRLGLRDWGSVLLHTSCSPAILPVVSSSPHLQPWYWNAKAVFDYKVGDQSNKQPVLLQSLAEGGDKLYKRGILS